jgi:hypothetical protein
MKASSPRGVAEKSPSKTTKSSVQQAARPDGRSRAGATGGFVDFLGFFAD